MDLRDKKTKIKFYSGMDTIGGTLIQVSYEDHSIYFDFGAEFKSEINEDELKGLGDILDHNLAPILEGVYDRRITGEDGSKYENKAVFVSHIHLDHTKMINYLDGQIPVYMSHDTKNLLEALNYDGSFLYINKLNDRLTRKLEGVDYNQEIHIGEIKVKFVRVDHDGYGACGFIITTPDLKISYTGDIRFHGYRKEDSENFIKESENSDILVMEGVSVSGLKNFEDFELGKEEETEEDLINRFSQILSSSKNKQVTFNYYEANLERLLNIEKVIEKNKRTMVLDQYNAFVMKKVLNKDYSYYVLEDRKFDLNPSYEVKKEDLLNDQNQYVWQLAEDNLSLVDDMYEGGVYIHCDAKPLGEFDVTYKPFINLFNKRNINLIELKCSGHAYPKDLLKIIDGIKPKVLVPIHSKNPEMLYNKYGDRILPERNQTI